MSGLAVKCAGRVAPRDLVAFKAEVQRWASRIGAQPRRVQVQRMTAKWASCSLMGRLCFSLDLLHEDEAFQAVVIVHELLHLHVPNHGKLFKSLMTAYVPGWTRVLGAGRELTVACTGRMAPEGRERSSARKANHGV